MSSSVEVSRLKCENSRLEYEKSRLYSELRESNERRDQDASTIRSLRREISKLNLVIEDNESKDSRLLRLEREKNQLRDNLLGTEARVHTERNKREEIETSLSEVEDDNSYLRQREAKERRQRLKLKTQLDETKCDLKRATRSQESLHSLLNQDQREYSRAEREFRKLKASWPKRRRSRSGYYLSSDSDEDDYFPTYKYSYKPYRHYLY